MIYTTKYLKYLVYLHSFFNNIAFYLRDNRVKYK